MIVSFNNYKIIKLSNKVASSEDFGEIHNVFHDDTSDNVDYMVQTGKYGAINKNEQWDIIPLNMSLTNLHYKKTQLLTVK